MLDRSGREIIKVLVATVTSEMCRYYEYYDSMDAIDYPPGSERIKYHSASPAKNRNQVIEYALKHPEFSHIFFTDDDHVFPVETIKQLLSHDVEIVSGLYSMKAEPFPIVAFDRVSEDNMLSRFIDMRNVPPDKLTEVKAVGAGCLLVKTSVFKKIAPPWFTLGQIWKDSWSDDMWFCYLCRKAGIPIYIDPIVRIGHMTKVMLTPTHDGKNWGIGFSINDGQKIQTNE